MTDFFLNADPKETATPVRALTTDAFEKWLKSATPSQKNWVKAVDFKSKPGTVCVIPGQGGRISQVLAGVESLTSPYSYGHLPQSLAPGAYRLVGRLSQSAAEAAALGWGLASYRHSAYKSTAKPDQKGKSQKSSNKKPQMVLPKNVDGKRVQALVESAHYVRDLINTPANDMGPAELEAAAKALAKTYDANCKIIRGEALEKGFPSVHMVGKAGEAPPRLIDLRGPKRSKSKQAVKTVTLVGKGVCFDTGGLNLKPAGNMLLMKKDMGGAAHVLGLAKMIWSLKLPIDLRVLIPAVENNVSHNAMRPMDVVKARNGKTIEIGHTDAEGRVTLADALSYACEENPDLLIDLTTLTGAARVALGTDIPALFGNNSQDLEQLQKLSWQVHDPLWTLPLHSGYQSQVEGQTADITNSGNSPFAGAITAALFLKEFVSEGTDWMHIDMMAWNTSDRPARPKGGEAMGLRALMAFVEKKIS